MCGRVVGIGVGASAVDNSAEALEAGAAEVRHLIRRKEMPRFNKLTKTHAVVDAICADGIDAAIEPRLQASLMFAMKLSKHNPVAKAINYMFEEDGRWEAFTRFLDDGRICLTNNAAERALRGIALGRKA